MSFTNVLSVGKSRTISYSTSSTFFSWTFPLGGWTGSRVYYVKITILLASGRQIESGIYVRFDAKEASSRMISEHKGPSALNCKLVWVAAVLDTQIPVF